MPRKVSCTESTISVASMPGTSAARNRSWKLSRLAPRIVTGSSGPIIAIDTLITMPK